MVEVVPSTTPTSAFAAPGVVNVDLGPLNRLTYLAAAGAARMFRAEIEAERETPPTRGATGTPAPRRRSSLSARSCWLAQATGWGGLALPGDLRGSDVLPVSSMPHELVPPRAAVAIHHGGAGTAHAAARAGIPSTVVPFLADQPFWGRRLHRTGSLPSPAPTGSSPGTG